MAECSVIFSPELAIDVQAFADFWNSQAALKQKAVAQVEDMQASATFDIPAWAMGALIFAGTMAANITQDIISDAVKSYVQQVFKGTENAQQVFEIIEKKTEDGKTLIIVLPKEEN